MKKLMSSVAVVGVVLSSQSGEAQNIEVTQIYPAAWAGGIPWVPGSQAPLPSQSFRANKSARPHLRSSRLLVPPRPVAPPTHLTPVYGMKYPLAITVANPYLAALPYYPYYYTATYRQSAMSYPPPAIETAVSADYRSSVSVTPQPLPGATAAAPPSLSSTIATGLTVKETTTEEVIEKTRPATPAEETVEK